MTQLTAWQLHVEKFRIRVAHEMEEHHADLHYNCDSFRENPAFRPFVISDYDAMLSAAAACGRDPKLVADDIAKIESEAEEIRRLELEAKAKPKGKVRTREWVDED